MLAIVPALTAIAGFLSSLIPALITLFTQKANNAHAEKMAQLQLDAQRLGGQISLATEEAKADTEQQRAIYSFATSPSGNKVVDALTSLVRPYITMVMFHVWLGMEVTILVIAMKTNMNAAEIVAVMWDDPTKAIFGAIMGFWFGSRVRRSFETQTIPIVRPVV